MNPKTETPPCPDLDPALVAHLQGAYRTEIEVPQKETSSWDIGLRAGKRHVLDYLERRLREQEQEKLLNHVHVQAQNP